MAASVPVQPQPDEDTVPYWEATASGRLALCWCPQCRRYLHPPLERCRDCAGPTHFEPVSGRGRVHSFIVVNRAVAPGYEDRTGQIIVLVDLEEQEGLRLVARLDEAGPGAVEIGDRVEARLQGLAGGDYRIPVFHRMSR